MKRPDLQYNCYYPYYTQKEFAYNTYQNIMLFMHLSNESGIRVSFDFEKKKISDLTIEYVKDRTRIIESQKGCKYITYPDYAIQIDTAYNVLCKAVKQLSSEPPYYIGGLWNSEFFKYNSSIELEFELRKILVSFGEVNYSIENGKKIRKKNEEFLHKPESEEDISLNKLSKLYEGINADTTYKEIDNKEFDKALNNTWDFFTEYFKCPAFIRKTKYEPNFK